MLQFLLEKPLTKVTYPLPLCAYMLNEWPQSGFSQVERLTNSLQAYMQMLEATVKNMPKGRS